MLDKLQQPGTPILARHNVVLCDDPDHCRLVEAIDLFVSKHFTRGVDQQRLAVGQTNVCIRLCVPAHVFNLTAHIAFDAHPLVGIIGSEIGLSADHDGRGEKVCRNAHSPTATATRTLLPPLHHRASLRSNTIHLLGAG
ncbi:hypothetical protein D3C86_1729020 [compost metagenome]